MTKSKLPPKIFVRWEDPANGEPYLAADATPDSAEEGDLVGVYELVETKTMVITRTLQAPLPTPDQIRRQRATRRANGPQRVVGGVRR